MVKLRRLRHQRGFTILELLIVVLIITLIMSMIVVSAHQARESARIVACQNNMRNIATYISERLSRKDSLCSGAFLPQYDGNIRQQGWIADLQDQAIPLNTLLCPSNVATRSESLSLPVLREAYAKMLLPVPNDNDDTLNTYANISINTGYNTNYCQVWWMARTELLPLPQRQGTDPNDVLDPVNCRGPLSQTFLQRFASDKIMLIGDAAWFEGGPDHFYAYAITGGPDPASLNARHDFSQLGLPHLGGKRKVCVLLFADFHAATVRDNSMNNDLEDEFVEERIILRDLRAIGEQLRDR